MALSFEIESHLVGLECSRPGVGFRKSRLDILTRFLDRLVKLLSRISL